MAPLLLSTAGPAPREIYGDPGLHYVRVNRAGAEPPAEPDLVDVAVLDMHHGFANLGHESIVDTLLEQARQERARLPKAPGFRIVSFDVRAGLAVPDVTEGRYRLLVGTGGPGALDPRENDGISPTSQGVKEDPTWEEPLYHLFDRVVADERISFLAICHTFGLMARWSGMAKAVLRPPEKGGKSAGLKQNVLTPEARRHPWFSELARANRSVEIQVLDSRLFDLIPTRLGKAVPLAFEEGDRVFEPGEAVTMLEIARDTERLFPRVWGVNFHPEIGDRGRQRVRMNRLAERGEVSAAWLEERTKALDAWNASEAAERGLQRTSAFTFEGPLRRIVASLLAEARGRSSR